MFLRRHTPRILVLALTGGVFVASYASHARADVSTWLGVGAGVTQAKAFDFDQSMTPTFKLSTGMGTDPSHPWIVGGMFRLDTLFGKGSDLSLLMRLASHSYVNGGWGVAVDVGPLARFWGQDSFGGVTVLTLGAPWGLEAGIQASLGNEHASSVGCFVGIDLARLTVYRRTGTSWWKNTFPAYRTPEEEEH
ncbi:MAG TPA: hypothetical protein VKP30_00915 [Polyangiaceae bacterium]|nr:hypothetical protein [Polyangiaceae bacterium]